MTAQDPVLAALRAGGKMSDDDLAFLERHGRPFKATRLPRSIKLREPGECFTVAKELDRAGWGAYGRGFALLPGDPRPLAHAWIVKYGAVLDASWPEELALAASYWGITKPGHEDRLRQMSRPFLKPRGPFDYRL